MDFITNTVIGLIERGRLSDRLTRSLARRLCRQRLRDLKRDDVTIRQFARGMRQAAVAPVPEKANEQHYELPAKFFELMLGPRLKYSCCYFEDSQATLDEAEVAALRQTCQHARISDGMQILELGCGWGSLTLWMLQHYPNATVTAVSNSRYQRELILARAAATGVSDRLEVVTADMNDFSVEERFDRVVSCEMFEHMRNYQELLARVSGWLKPGGRLLVHLFCHREFIYEFETGGASNWMGRYFFTGGIMPGFRIFEEFADDLEVEESWVWDGTHYERTCNAWLNRLDRHRQPAMEVLVGAYGAKQAARWFHRWRLFLIAGAELFGFQQGQQWQVAHYLLKHSEVRQPEPAAKS